MNRTMSRFAAACLLAVAIGGGRACWADPPAPETARIPQIKFTDYRLDNGLRVLLSVDHSAPVIAVSVTYNVGSRNEQPGHAGFAHLFEHMMFQGSQNVGKGEHMMLIQENGGTMNGTTNQDRTNYFEAMPSNQLDLALFLESDRMRSLDISPANLENQRAVVEEEKRQSYDNQPYGHVTERVLDLAYSGFPYKHDTIGSNQDLDAASLEDVRSFFKTYYAPNNACLAVVGDFDEATAKRKVEQYFGSIPRQPDPPPVVIDEQPIGGEKRKTLSDPLARLTRYEAAYKTVSGNDPDSYALQILGDILSAGRTSRLYSAIVDKRIALNATANGFFGRGPSLFTFSATLPPNGSVDDVEKAWDAEVARIQTEGVTQEEMQKARTQERARMLIGFGRFGGGLQTALGRANALTQNAIYFNDPGRINTLLPRLDAVTADDVKRVANKYLTRDNRVVVIDEPAPEDNSADSGASTTSDQKGGK
ncbi:MAG TPA: pitrilysin family protein [Chthonomonadaceae bacterium]|nr:pitrilysin family protein [Chthonomonadaceae bacterium]